MNYLKEPRDDGKDLRGKSLPVSYASYCTEADDGVSEVRIELTRIKRLMKGVLI